GEAALHAARPHHLPNRYRLRPAFQRERSEIAIIEVPPSESAGARADQHSPWLRKRLQACGEVWSLTNDGLLRPGFTNQQLAHNDSARCNAKPSLQCGVDICPDIRYGIDECERGAYCLFGIIFLRVRIAEIGEHAMTHDSGD